MDVYTLLKTDHQEAMDLLEKLEHTTAKAPMAREELMYELKNELELHMFLEETIFYPAIKKRIPGSDLPLEAFEEHGVVKKMLLELEECPREAEEFAPKVKVLKENLEHHIQEEENNMFQKARGVFSDDEAAKIGSEMATEKARLKAAV